MIRTYKFRILEIFKMANLVKLHLKSFLVNIKQIKKQIIKIILTNKVV